MKSLMELTIEAGYGEPLSREKNEELCKHLKTDPEARTKMIYGNMPLVIVKVDGYLRAYPEMRFYRDDLISEGLLELTQAVDDLIARPDTIANPTGYLYRAIEHRLSDNISGEATIRVPPGSQWKAIQQTGTGIQVKQRASEPAEQAAFARLEADDVNAAMELEEEIAICCLDDADKQIVHMRKQGHTDEAISQALNISRSMVWTKRRVIYDRLLARCPEYATSA